MAQEIVHASITTGIPETEYSVYVYHYADDIEDGYTDWEMKAATLDVQEAVDQAQSLYNTREFKKVEVKKKYFDAKFGRVIDATHKVFQNKRRASRRSSVMALLGLSCFVGIGLIAVPFIGRF